jgi:uncharacterized membrane protein YdjX (TVP38/TMEM64 family)
MELPAMKRFWPIMLIVAVLLLAWWTGVGRYLSWESLAANRAWLAQQVAAAPVASALVFLGVYAGAVAVSLPVGVWFTLTSGLLFGPWLGTGLAVLGAGTGACLAFLATRHAFAAPLLARGGPLLARIRAGLETGGFWYLLSLRLLPVVPFWVTNLGPGLVGMRLAPFALATFLGILPATTIFVVMGSGLGDILASGGRPDLGLIFSPAVLGPLVGLAALSLLGAWWRSRRATHA